MNSSKSAMETFKTLVSGEIAVPVAAMNSLILVIRESKATTWMQLEYELRDAIVCLKGCSKEDLGGRTAISLGSGCDLFMKYVSRAFNLESMEFSACKDELLRRGERFAGMSLSSRSQIAEIGHGFVQDGSTVLIHGRSRVVESVLLKAAESKQFNVIVTEGRPNHLDGAAAAKVYTEAGIPTTVVADAAVGTIMDQIDLCLMGAEGVMENGGVINKLGTYQIAMVAKALGRPFYVAVESYKFARMYPLTQRDIVDMCGDSCLPTSPVNVPPQGETIFPLQGSRPVTGCEGHSCGKGGRDLHSTIDFTPAEFITLLFTDLGVLTPAAVSDELIKLYQ